MNENAINAAWHLREYARAIARLTTEQRAELRVDADIETLRHLMTDTHVMEHIAKRLEQMPNN